MTRRAASPWKRETDGPRNLRRPSNIWTDVEPLLPEGRAIDIQSKANTVSGQSEGATFTPGAPTPSRPE